MTILLDFYGALLTPKQRNLLELYYEQDLSLGEIADLEGTSRQAVHDVLRRAEKTLFDYEDKLALAAKFNHQRELLQAALAELRAMDLKPGTPLEKAVQTLERVLAEE